MEFKDYYKILAVNRNVNSEEIEKAYRKLARRYHPDINPDDQSAKERFEEINEAYQVLTNLEARAKYDRLGASWDLHQRTGDNEPFDWSSWRSTPLPRSADSLEEIWHGSAAEKDESHLNFFEAIFGGMNLTKNDLAPHKGEDYQQTIEILLEEAFTGATRILRVGHRRLEVKIPRGTDTGTKIRVRGEGGEGVNGGPKGDLYLEIQITPDSNFRREGEDLHLDLPVDVYSAVLGGEVIVPLLKGIIKLRIPPGTQSGKVFRLRGQGMPKLKNTDERGDLYARVMITVPEDLTELEIELFEELADLRGL